VNMAKVEKVTYLNNSRRIRLYAIFIVEMEEQS
jgi:hypothetical protein